MNRNLIFNSAVLAAVLSLVALPATAQQRRGNGHGAGEQRATSGDSGRQQDGGRAVPREGSRDSGPRSAGPRSSERPQSAPEQSAPRGYEPRQSAPQAAPRGYERPQLSPQVAPRGYEPRQSAPPAGPRAYDRGQTQPRGYDRPSQPRAVPRSYDRPSYQAPRYGDDRRGYGPPRGSYGYRGYSAPRYYSRLYVRPHNWAPYRPFYFSRPYYSFRPRFSIGFGLWIGYPVSYPYAYLGSYRPRVYGYYPGSGYAVSIYGGLSFDIRPSDADLFVDGEYVGAVGYFTPGSEPLTLTPGTHRIAVQRDGFRAMEWDVTIEPGQVIPFRGDMQPY